MQALVWAGRISLVAAMAIVLCGLPADDAQAADEARSAEESLSSEQSLSADDGWRRTALGWERTGAWTEPTNHGRPRDRFLFADENRQVADRWDFHPAWLVGLQLAAVMLGLAAWSHAPVKTRAAENKGAAGSLGHANERRPAA